MRAALSVFAAATAAAWVFAAAAQQFAPDATAPADPTTGIRVPAGFRVTVFAEGVGRARHIVARDNGDLYVALREGGGIVALRDADGDGVAELQERWRADSGTGIGIRDGFLYYSSDQAVMRVRLQRGELLPSGAAETVVSGFPEQTQHASKAFAFDGAGHIYVNVGAPSNNCQQQTRTRHSPGRSPCPQLERQASIWRFRADRTGQTQVADGLRYVSGARNTVALGWHRGLDALLVAMHGRDQLHEFWPEHYTVEDNARLPAEEFHKVAEGADLGWPYTYYDGVRGQRMVAPEYGGNGRMPAPAGDHQDPLIAFPAHWAPNGLLVYTGEQFPPAFRGGVFIAFHGSWNRAPLVQAGYNVVFVPLDDDGLAGAWHVFADGFPGVDPVESSKDAKHRPMGLAQGPDGSLFIADSVAGRIWKISWGG